MIPKIQLSASVYPDLKTRIETLAQAERRSVSAMLEILLEETLHERGQEDPQRGEQQ